MQFSGNEWGLEGRGATQRTVVLANDLPGSHDVLNVGWASGCRLPKQERAQCSAREPYRGRIGLHWGPGKGGLKGGKRKGWSGGGGEAERRDAMRQRRLLSPCPQGGGGRRRRRTVGLGWEGRRHNKPKQKPPPRLAPPKGRKKIKAAQRRQVSLFSFFLMHVMDQPELNCFSVLGGRAPKQSIGGGERGEGTGIWAASPTLDPRCTGSPSPLREVGGREGNTHTRKTFRAGGGYALELPVSPFSLSGWPAPGMPRTGRAAAAFAEGTGREAKAVASPAHPPQLRAHQGESRERPTWQEIKGNNEERRRGRSCWGRKVEKGRGARTGREGGWLEGTAVNIGGHWPSSPPGIACPDYQAMAVRRKEQNKAL